MFTPEISFCQSLLRLFLPVLLHFIEHILKNKKMEGHSVLKAFVIQGDEGYI